MRIVTDADVVVVGAGVTGLMAAYRLAQAGRSVVVLDARDRVGGRLWTDTRDGVLLELGGQWVSPDQQALLDLIEELGLETFARYRDGQMIYVDADRQRRMFTGERFPVAEPTAAEIIRLTGLLHEMSLTMDPDAPWAMLGAEHLDTVSLADWLTEQSDDAEACEIVGLFVGAAMLGKPTRSFSVLQALYMAASAGGFAHLADADFILDRRVVGGLQSVPLRLAERATGLGVDIRLGCPARRITWQDNAVRVEADECVINANRVLIAVPPPTVRRLEFSPALPPVHQQWRQHQSFGQVIKVHATYPTPFWRAEGLSGTAFSPYLTVHEAYDNTNHHAEQGTLVGFVSDRRADELLALEPADRMAIVLDSFAAYFGDEARHPVSYVESDWFSDGWTGGAYASSFDLGGMVRYGPVVGDPVGPMLFGSSDVAGHGFQHVDGAVRMGMRLADAVLDQALSRATG